MAYRRRQPAAPATTTSFPDLLPSPPAFSEEGPTSPPPPPPSLAAQAIRASAAHRDSSLSSAYGEPAANAAAARRDSASLPSPRDRGSSTYEYTSMKNLNEEKYGFWGTLARKAKSFLDEDNSPDQFETPRRKQSQTDSTSISGQFQNTYQLPEDHWKSGTPPQQSKSDSLASSFTYIGGTIKNAFEEGRSIVENKTADIIHETRKLNIRRKGGGLNSQGEAAEKSTQRNLPKNPFDYETQLKASRDVANAMAAKAKLLLRELKTVKADLAFAKERCAQLEEENKMLRESHENGDSPEDDDLIRLQLETLLAEKARLAHENSVYARENRFLREIVEYHQLTMQDVIYVNEGIEEVTEVYPTQVLPPAPTRSASDLARPAAPTPPNKPATMQTSPVSTSIVVPESCPIVPTSPRSLSRTPSVSQRASPPPPTIAEEEGALE